MKLSALIITELKNLSAASRLQAMQQQQQLQLQQQQQLQAMAEQQQQQQRPEMLAQQTVVPLPNPSGNVAFAAPSLSLYPPPAGVSAGGGPPLPQQQYFGATVPPSPMNR